MLRVCGEIAFDPEALPIWLGLGLREFSLLTTIRNNSFKIWGPDALRGRKKDSHKGHKGHEGLLRFNKKERIGFPL
jgi:hypothetical protein